MLSVLVSLTLFFGLQALAYRIGRAMEAGRRDAVLAEQLLRLDAQRRQQHARLAQQIAGAVHPSIVRVEASVDAGNRPAGTNPAAADDRTDFVRICGVVIDPQGFVLTNHLPLTGARSIRVLVGDSSAFLGTLVGTDADTDLAVVKFEPPPGRRLEFANLSPDPRLAPGERVVAVGHAFDRQHWLWLGEVGYSGRSASAAGCAPTDLIRTTAVNRRNSGGPLVNLQGEVVGLSISWDGEDNSMGYAVPASTASRVAE